MSQSNPPRSVPVELRFLLAPVVVAVLAIAAACGRDGAAPTVQNERPAGADQPSLERYFQQLRAAAEKSQQRADALALETGIAAEAFASEEEALAAIQAFFDGYIPILRDYVDTLAHIEPPAEAQNAHKETVDALADLLEVMNGQAREIAEAESFSEAEGLFAEPAFAAADDRVAEACLALQDIADANGIHVDLDCEPILP